MLLGLVLSFYHFMIGYINTLSSKDKIIDSTNYFRWGTSSYSDLFEFSSGTGFIVHLIQWLNIVFKTYEQYSAFFIAITLVAFFKILAISSDLYQKRKISNYEFLLISIIIFIPGFHYWTVSIGKDSLALFSIFFSFYSYYKRRLIVLILSLLLLFLIRAHVFGMLVISIMLSEYFFQYNNFFKVNKRVYKFILMSLLILFSSGMFVFLFTYIQKYSADGFSSLDDFFDSRADVYADLGSGAWLSVQPYPIKIFAFIFGGVPWISIDSLTIVSMLESSIVFTIFLYTLFKLRRKFKHLNVQEKATVTALLAFITIMILLFSYSNNNLGVMVRMKVMIYSPIALLSIITFSSDVIRNKQTRNERIFERYS